MKKVIILCVTIFVIIAAGIYLYFQVIDKPLHQSISVEDVATVDFKFKKLITSDNGVQSRFILLKKESDKSGWRIQSEGTGP